MPTTAMRSIRWSIGLLLLAMVTAPWAYGAEYTTTQDANTWPAPVKRTTQEDHQRMMSLLNITSIRPGANGMNPQAKDYANYDESKANPFPNLPDPLVLKNGQKVTTAAMWWDQRRPEIVAMAYDQRFAIAYVSSSGEGGAKLHRRNWGEIVENVAGSGEYHWMAGNFIQYAGPLNWGDIPIDSHELVALYAPRPVFLSAGATNGDAWVDAKGTFLAGVGVGPVYRLLGKKDMGVTEFPAIETTLTDGDVAFRQHSGGHTDGPNWPIFLTFADRSIKGPPLRHRSSYILSTASAAAGSASPASGG